MSGTTNVLTTRFATSRSMRLRLLALAIAGAGLLTIAAPADASIITPQGAKVGAFADGSMYTHQFTVRPYATTLSGWTAQYVSYRVTTRERETGTYRTFGWNTPYLVQAAASITSCSNLGGCPTVSFGGVPANLPTQVFYGPAGHHFDVWVQMAHWTAAGYVYSGWAIIDSCVTGTLLGQSCAT